jgi:uncharacterized RDD family membrane protein YckC
MPDPSGPRASFGRRFVAVLVDGIILGIPIGITVAIAQSVGIYVLVAVISLAYLVYFEGSPSGQTAGKRLLGIRVIDFSTGGPIGYGRAAIRAVARYISQIPCYLGYLWMLWDKEKQTWHDKLANDVVVPVSHYPVERWPG